MEKRNQLDVNTQEYWNDNYKKGERAGSWKTIKPFLDYEIQKVLSDDKVSLIDVGGGTGLFAQLVKNDFPQIEVCNLDISSYATTLGKEKYPQVSQVCLDVNQDFPSELLEKFDFVICQELLEHIKEPLHLLDSLWSMVKKGGLLWISCPHDEGNWAGIEHINLNFTHDDVHIFWGLSPEITFCKCNNYNEELSLAFKARKRK